MIRRCAIMAAMTGRWARDPLSELLDEGARDFLTRVYAARGQWVTTRLADPNPAVDRFARDLLGIDPEGPDDARVRTGKPNPMRSRWARAFARAVYHQHKWYGGVRGLRSVRRMEPYRRALEIEAGRRMPARGIVPAGRIMRARLRPGGKKAISAVVRKPDSQRIYDDHYQQGAKASLWDLRTG
jgi:hypothetical protein